MKIVLVTNSSPHHLFWVKEMSANFILSAVVFITPKKSRKATLKQYNIYIRFFWYALKILSYAFYVMNRRNIFKVLSKLEKERYAINKIDFFGDLRDKQIKIFNSQDINSDDTIRFINLIEPDVICFLGGDLAKKNFFSSVKALILNFHSGISPFFNGSGTTFHTCASSTPLMCGGTLMIMNERVDGGEILSYYLSPICKMDNPALIFLKGIEGSVKLYKDFLDNYAKGVSYYPVKQPRPLYYFRSYDWTIYHDLKLDINRELKTIEKYSRDEEIIRVYDSMEKDIHWIYGELIKKVL